MAAPYNPPVKNEDFIIYVALQSASDPKSFQSNPTIAAGDFKVSKDGGALSNLATLPSVEPAASVLVKITLSATEMNADSVVVVGIDQTATKEWADFILSIPTTSA
jgi:hypothetical protein